MLGFLAVPPAPPTTPAPLAPSSAPIRLPGLQSAARLIQDRNGVTHIEAASFPGPLYLAGVAAALTQRTVIRLPFA